MENIIFGKVVLMIRFNLLLFTYAFKFQCKQGQCFSRYFKVSLYLTYCDFFLFLKISQQKELWLKSSLISSVIHMHVICTQVHFGCMRKDTQLFKCVHFYGQLMSSS